MMFGRRAAICRLLLASNDEQLLYFNLNSFANVVVEVPNGTMTAVIHKKENPRQPNWFRHHRYLVMGVIFSSWLLTRSVLRYASYSFARFMRRPKIK